MYLSIISKCALAFLLDILNKWILHFNSKSAQNFKNCFIYEHVNLHETHSDFTLYYIYVDGNSTKINQNVFDRMGVKTLQILT